MKMKLLILTTILIFSYNVMMEMDVVSASEQNDSSMEELYKILDPSSDVNEVNADDVPFLHLLAGSMPLFYPPLELSMAEEQRYIVSQGDNLFRIALNHGIDLELLKSWNGLVDDLIHPGEELIIKGGDASDVIVTAMISDSVKVASVSPEKVVTESVAKTTETVTKTVSEKPVSAPVVVSTPPSSGLEMTVTATAYTAYCKGCSGTTATGIDLRSNPERKVIAVDPTVIPLGTRVWVEGYGEAIAGDVGGAIKGHKIDVFIPSYENAMQWGVKKVKIKVLN